MMRQSARIVGNLSMYTDRSAVVVIDGKDVAFHVANDDHPEIHLLETVTVEFDPQDQFAKIVLDEETTSAFAKANADMVNLFTDGTIGDDIATHFSCQECEVVCAFLEAHGETEAAQTFREFHARADDEGDSHWELRQKLEAEDAASDRRASEEG